MLFIVNENIQLLYIATACVFNYTLLRYRVQQKSTILRDKGDDQFPISSK